MSSRAYFSVAMALLFSLFGSACLSYDEPDTGANRFFACASNDDCGDEYYCGGMQLFAADAVDPPCFDDGYVNLGSNTFVGDPMGTCEGQDCAIGICEGRQIYVPYCIWHTNGQECGNARTCNADELCVVKGYETEDRSDDMFECVLADIENNQGVEAASRIDLDSTENENETATCTGRTGIGSEIWRVVDFGDGSVDRSIRSFYCVQTMP